MIVKLLTEHQFEFLSLKGGCRGSSESTLIKLSNCWNSHAAAHYYNMSSPYVNTFIKLEDEIQYRTEHLSGDM